MGLYRTALRLATVETLCPTALIGGDGPWPTLAENRVYDSRLDPIEDVTADLHKAAIAVYTAMDEGYAAQRRGGPPFRRIVDLVFEISQIASEPSEADPAVYIAGIPGTDSRLEAELDRIQSEIALALFGSLPGHNLFRKLVRDKVTDPRVAPHRTSEEGVRLAIRTVTWKVEVDDDVFVGAPKVALVGLDRLPDPLRWVAKALPENSEGMKTAVGLASTMPTMPVATPLAEVAISAEVIPAMPVRALRERLETKVQTPNMAADAANLENEEKPRGR